MLEVCDAGELFGGTPEALADGGIFRLVRCFNGCHVALAFSTSAGAKEVAASDDRRRRSVELIQGALFRGLCGDRGEDPPHHLRRGAAVFPRTVDEVGAGQSGVGEGAEDR